jgi:hypothetical protein
MQVGVQTCTDESVVCDHTASSLAASSLQTYDPRSRVAIVPAVAVLACCGVSFGKRYVSK